VFQHTDKSTGHANCPCGRSLSPRVACVWPRLLRGSAFQKSRNLEISFCLCDRSRSCSWSARAGWSPSRLFYFGPHGAGVWRTGAERRARGAGRLALNSGCSDSGSGLGLSGLSGLRACRSLWLVACRFLSLLVVLLLAPAKVWYAEAVPYRTGRRDCRPPKEDRALVGRLLLLAHLIAYLVGSTPDRLLRPLTTMMEYTREDSMGTGAVGIRGEDEMSTRTSVVPSADRGAIDPRWLLS
jgi:hypothetical protein